MSAEIAEQVRHIAEELSAGTDAQWAREWHESNCSRYDEADSETLEEHLEWCDERPSAGDYLESVLDIEYVIGSDKRYRGARVLVTFGGPTIWVDTQRNRVDGYWWNDEAHQSFTDALGLDEYLSELWES